MWRKIATSRPIPRIGARISCSSTFLTDAEEGCRPLLTVGETLAHADNLDGGPRLAGRGLDAAFLSALAAARCDRPASSANTARHTDRRPAN